jgi:hypothetical protein
VAITWLVAVSGYLFGAKVLPVDLSGHPKERNDAKDYPLRRRRGDDVPFVRFRRSI